MTKYVVIPIDELNTDMFDASVQKSLAAVRKNIPETKCILKFHGLTPVCFDVYDILSADQISTILATEEWGDVL